ncbi:MAG TPA: alkaline phosphatase family protein [Phycisphaerae bacterium]|nr:alkaline phosphatase family protein [Phycisphaerae bacterium]
MAELTNAKHTDFPAVAGKVLILGLDGATFDVMGPLMDAGRMPNLKRLVDGGTSGIMHSTVPPITPAAWTTFMTGINPGIHGIIDFERYDVKTNALGFNSTNALSHVRSIWQILSDKGYRVGSINVPMTFPPVPVNGFLISGFEAVSTKTDFTHPPELKSEILNRWPDYSFKNKWKRKTFGGDALFAENLKDITRTFHQGAEVLEFCGDKYGWDVMMIVFKMVDNLQHKVWRYLDPRTRDRFGKRSQMALDCFAELDVAIGKIMAYAEQHNAHIFMMSDHGHGSLEGKVQPNLMLEKWGYLSIRGGGAQSRNRVRQRLAKLFRKKGKFAAGSFSLEDDLAVDFSATRAAVVHAGMAGFLYINLKGRQDTGIVEPSEYESLRDELKKRLEEVTCKDPSGKEIKIFDAVHKPEELYGCSREKRDWLPDLMLSPKPSLAVVRKIRGNRFVSWVPLHRMEGTHRPEGVFAVYGPGVVAGKKLDVNLIDATPTILSMLGLAYPGDMGGKVITDAFSPALQKRVDDSSSVEASESMSAGASAYSQEDLQKLTARLADLGYLE